MSNTTKTHDDLGQALEILGLNQHRVVQERKDFLLFSREDEERIKKIAPAVKKHADSVVDAIYDHLVKYPETKRFLPDEATIRHLKVTQKAYFNRLLDGPYDERYVEERVRIGLAHVRVDLKPQWYMGTYCLYLRLVTEALFKEAGGTFRKSNGGLLPQLESLMKVIFFDMALSIDAYISRLMQDQVERDGMRTVLEQVAESSRHLASASEELSASSRQMGASAEETTRQASAVSAASEQTNRNVQTVATAAEEMSATIKEISNSVQEATRITSQAVKTADSTNSTISKLGDSSAEIGKVIKVITSIAQQTNLLALNATIEAARAGEAGKGFAVVANEVKELAKQTAKATEEISRQIEAIQSGTKGAVAAIGEIGKIIGQINEISTTIAGAMEEQSATTAEITRNVSEAAKGTGEVTRNITGVATASKSTADGASNVLSASQRLAKMAAELEALVGSFNAKTGK